MCGRYLLRGVPEFDRPPYWSRYWQDLRNFIARYNVAPGEPACVVREGGELLPMRWGFRPRWSRHRPMVNARAESLFRSRYFRDAAHATRCLVLADGFYEPRGPSGARNRPWYLFEYPDQRHFALAGVWTRGPRGEPGFCIITVPAHAEIGPIHERMPLIPTGGDWLRWLDPGARQAQLEPLLRVRDYGLQARPVGDYVKRVGNEGPRCVAAP